MSGVWALAGTARVITEVTSPSDQVTVSALTETAPGIFTGTASTTASGVYRVLVRAHGTDHHGVRFTREELRTLAVWAAGDTRPTLPGGHAEPGGHPEGGGLDACALLTCLLAQDGIRELLKRHEIDPDEVAACVKQACR